MALSLIYVLEELKNDIFFLEKNYASFLRHLERKNKNMITQSRKALKKLSGISFNSFITDRDGTINNYCARYLSSVQSAYNSIFISKFSKSLTKHSIIITSAPLEGILEMSVDPPQTFIYAGSKGREFMREDSTLEKKKMSSSEEKIMQRLSEKISRLLSEKEFQDHLYIGSGLQKKFGQLTIARQDITGSIPKKDSLSLLEKIQRIVKEIDPKDSMLAIEDTGLDIEIILKRGERAFDKGDGVKYIAKSLKIDLSKGTNLVCGDTSSDIALAKKVKEINPATIIIFVTRKDSLKKKVRSFAKDAIFVDNPDTLITIFYKLANQ